MSASPGADRLDLDEGVPLGYALVARLAADHDIRALAIKGPTLEELGLRPPRQSLDVDVLVEPGRFDDLLEVLAGAGWSPPAVSATGGHVIPPHSVSMSHPAWPQEIDVHHYFPGFLAPPEVVFDALWRERATMKVAGQPVRVPSRPAAAAVGLLHLLRGGERRVAELEGLLAHLSAALTTPERQQLAVIADATGAAGPLRSSLMRLGVTSSRAASADQEASTAWDLVRDLGAEHTVGWLVTFRRTPLRCWPALLWRALWLTEGELRTRYPAARPGRLGLIGMWVDRWWTGLRALPRAVLLVRDHWHQSGPHRAGRTGD
ncbi:nucleotidyltransferase family protein [Nocardioides marmoribigeumensis]|uniref:Nucleotidyltransferase family protein n=1 Tax=Nocardioides marmoribigeumensis TaxID=433649 RepID=A0ABU2BTP7_9ACTN|nr:nucleotidyltransferase family protein [Nocardioides marmoribigeumensis]MDR7361997.1 hypothetical protein [Nocardioides marmoribigeumensis]